MVLHDIKHKISPLMQNYIAARKKITDSEIPLICQIHDHIQKHTGGTFWPSLLNGDKYERDQYTAPYQKI